MAGIESQEDIIKIQLELGEEPCRLDALISRHLADYSRTRVQSFIEEGVVEVNGKPQLKASYKLQRGDVVTVFINKAPKINEALVPADLSLSILFEDDTVIVVNKPAGMVVHPGAGETGPTLAEALLHHSKQLSRVSEERPGIVHRLDKDTSGVIVCAKTDEAHHHLAKQFEKKTNFRQYLALLDGLMLEKQSSITTMIARDPSHRTKMKSFPLNQDISGGLPVRGREAKSHFTRDATYAKRLTLVSVQLETGRTHQIRVHAKDMGMPVWGDPVYNRATELPSLLDQSVRDYLLGLPRQMLHARYLGFEHPKTGEKLAFEAPLPKDFQDALLLLEPFKDPL